MNQVIQLDGILSNVQNDQIQVYSSTTISGLNDQFDSTIESSSVIGQSQILLVLSPDSIVSTELFGESQLNQFVVLQSIQSTVAFGDTKPQLSIVVADEIESELQFGTSQLNFKLYPQSFALTNAFETDYGYNFKMYANAVNPTATFGDFTQLNMEIDDVPFPSIESTLVIPNPTLRIKVAPVSIATTVNFGISSFIDNIHRILVFKDDNISKIGENDAAVIAGGIRLNPSSTASNTASSGSAELPENPVGFLSVNIGGVDYKIPYYNS